jgi:hypothetical protein
LAFDDHEKQRNSDLQQQIGVSGSCTEKLVLELFKGRQAAQLLALGDQRSGVFAKLTEQRT